MIQSVKNLVNALSKNMLGFFIWGVIMTHWVVIIHCAKFQDRKIIFRPRRCHAFFSTNFVDNLGYR